MSSDNSNCRKVNYWRKYNGVTEPITWINIIWSIKLKPQKYFVNFFPLSTSSPLLKVGVTVFSFIDDENMDIWLEWMFWCWWWLLLFLSNFSSGEEATVNLIYFNIYIYSLLYSFINLFVYVFSFLILFIYLSLLSDFWIYFAQNIIFLFFPFLIYEFSCISLWFFSPFSLYVNNIFITHFLPIF